MCECILYWIFKKIDDTLVIIIRFIRLIWVIFANSLYLLTLTKDWFWWRSSAKINFSMLLKKIAITVIVAIFVIWEASSIIIVDDVKSRRRCEIALNSWTIKLNSWTIKSRNIIVKDDWTVGKSARKKENFMKSSIQSSKTQKFSFYRRNSRNTSFQR
jgi:hypothetical protein